MPDLKSVSNSPPQSSKGTSPDPRDGQRNRGAAPRSTNHNFTSLLEICQEGAKAVEASSKQAERKLEETLADVPRLRRYIRSHPQAEKKLEKAYEKAEIRITGRTTNPFTPLVKLVFPANIKRATLSRYAGALWLAAKEKVKSDDFIEFVRGKGGVTECARLATAKRRQSGGQPDPEEILKEKLKQRRARAPVLPLKRKLLLPKLSPHLLLVERATDGSYRLLGHRDASDREVSSFLSD